jgi:hypothetical protein
MAWNRRNVLLGARVIFGAGETALVYTLVQNAFSAVDMIAASAYLSAAWIVTAIALATQPELSRRIQTSTNPRHPKTIAAPRISDRSSTIARARSNE